MIALGLTKPLPHDAKKNKVTYGKAKAIPTKSLKMPNDRKHKRSSNPHHFLARDEHHPFS